MRTIETLEGLSSKNKLTPRVILKFLKNKKTYDDTIKFLNDKNYDPSIHAKFTIKDDKQLQKILGANGYKDLGTTFSDFNSVAFAVAFNNRRGLFTTPTSFQRISPLVAEGILSNDLFMDSSKKISLLEMYHGILGEEKCYSISLAKSSRERVLPDVYQVSNSTTLYGIKCGVLAPTTSRQEELLLNELNEVGFKITDRNSYLLWSSPAILLYSLENNYEETMKYLDSGFFNMEKHAKEDLLSFAPSPVSEYILKKISDVLRKNNFDYESSIISEDKSTNLYIALAGIYAKNQGHESSLSYETFDKYCMLTDNSNMSAITLNTLFKMCKESNQVKFKSEAKTILKYVLKNGINDSNFGEMKQLAMWINNGVIPPFYMKKSFVSVGENKQFLMHHTCLKKEDIEALLMVNEKSYEQIDESQILKEANVENGVSLEEAVRQIAHKKFDELKIQEMNLILALACRILKEKGLGNIKVNLSGSCVGENYGFANEKNIYLTLGSNLTIREMVRVIYHEVNHELQYKNQKEMNFKEDEGILDYAKDGLLRIILGEAYHKHNYLRLSHEFDADIKAKIEASLFFDEVDTLFEESKEEFKKIREDVTHYKSDFRRGVEGKEGYEYSLDELFDKIFLSKIIKSNECEKKDLIETIRKDYPILEYEYDLNTGIRRQIPKLIELMVNGTSEERELYEYILKNRCDSKKVGEFESKRSLETIEKIMSTYKKIDKEIKKIEDLKANIENSQDYFYSFMEFIDKKLKEMKKL